MKVTTENTDTRLVTLSIEPDAERIARAKRRAASALSKYRPIPGYRPGKAPLAMVERVFGADTVLKEAVNEAAEDIFREAVLQAEIDPYQPGELEIASTDPLLLKIQVSLMPTAELGDYLNLRITPEPDPVVQEAAVDAEIEDLREKAATYEPVERPIMSGDQVVLDFTATEEDSGQPLLHEEALEILVSPQEEPYALADKLLAMRAGESAEVDVDYDAEYKNKTLAGKSVHVQFTVQAVREKTLPEVNDEFAKDVSDYETLAELRQSIRDRLQKEADEARRNRETEAALKALVDASVVEYPTAAVDRELESMIENEKRRVQGWGFEWANYLRLIRRTEEEMRSELRPRAEQRLVRGLVLSKFAEAEGLQIDADEVSAALDRMAGQYGERAEEAKKALVQAGALASIANDQLSRRAVEHLVAVLTGREAAHPVTAAAEAAAQAAGELEAQEQSAPAESGPTGEDASAAEAAPAAEDAPQTETPSDPGA